MPSSAILHSVPFRRNVRWLVFSLLIVPLAAGAQTTEPLPGTQPLTWEGDLSARMVAGIDKFFMGELDRFVVERQKLWQRDFSSRAAYDKSVQQNRQRFQTYVGAVDPRRPVKALEYVTSTAALPLVAETDRFRVYGVRWPVFQDVHGEGLLLQPKSELRARVVALPDADQTPEMLVGLAPGLPRESQFARRLAEHGCQVIVPVLIDRQDTWSGNAQLKRFTNQPHREWIYRQAYEMGRHIIGYEVQKVLAAVDWFTEEESRSSTRTLQNPMIGVAGFAEGGLIALYSAALDTRIDAALVSGYFAPRQRVWEEPIYRNVFGLLHEFGDAEIASLIAPRSLTVEFSEVPRIDGPPQAREGRRGAAPGKLSTPARFDVAAEIERTRGLFPKSFPFPLEFIHGPEGTTVGPVSGMALSVFLKALGIARPTATAAANALVDKRTGFDPAERQGRQVQELVHHTQSLLQLSERVRDEFFWRRMKPSSPDQWTAAATDFKENFWEEVIGRLPRASMPVNSRSRKIADNAKWTAYDVVLDVWPDVFAWGILLVPKDLKPGERRPVVVCQHGLEGLPIDTISEDSSSRAFGFYKSFAARLAERGFVTFAPHNPYRGQDAFRVLQRKANPLKKSLFSVIVGQHDRILDWLSELPFVDQQRIAFYGLSYGGKTAMRVPSLLDRYRLSICSADFNEWIRKNVTVDSPYSYLFTNEYEMPEFNLGHTFNYAEMAALIAPRPFMVERGHDDGVAPDEWVAYEYAKIRRLYDKLGIGDRTAIEFFNGPHTINGAGTFEFLHRHLNWPNPQ
jgi:dienelactone hydrolase